MDPPLGFPASIDFRYLSEAQAKSNHSQTLTRLNERGGLAASEAIANIERRRYRPMSDAECIAAWRSAQAIMEPPK